MIDFSKMPVLPEADKFNDMILRVGKQVEKAKSDWTDRVMEKLLPPVMYALSKTAKGKASDRKKLIKHLESRKIHLAEHADRTAIMEGDKAISEFRFRVNGKQVECQIRKYDSSNSYKIDHDSHNPT